MDSKSAFIGEPMMQKLFLSAVLGGAMVLANPGQAAEGAGQSASVYVFTSFRGDGDGLHLAWSKDGYQWSDLNRVFLKPTVGGKLMRDPHILLGPDGVYRMVWTTGWRDNGIGYASSTNLLDWQGQ